VAHDLRGERRNFGDVRAEPGEELVEGETRRGVRHEREEEGRRKKEGGKR
jgi:hypothetical protein